MPTSHSLQDERFLTSAAILKVNWDRKQDFVDNFVGFVAHLMAENQYVEVAVDTLQTDFRHRFGVSIPQGILKTILNRAARRGLVVKEHGLYKYVRDQRVESDFEAIQAQAMADHGAIVNDLMTYAERRFGVALTQADADAGLLRWTEQHSFGLLQRRLEETRTVPTGDRRELIIAAFVVELYERSLPGLDRLETLARGVMLYNLLYLPDPGSAQRGFNGTKIFLDTRLLLRALGLSGDVMQRPVKELLVLIRESGGYACCFEHTFEEMGRVLHAVAMQMERDVYEAHGEITEFLITADYTPSDVAEIGETLESRLAAIDVPIEPASADGDYRIEEERLESMLRQELKVYRERYRPLRADVESLRGIHRFRRGKVYHRLEDAPALFVTSNVVMARVATRFFDEEPWTGRAQHCLADHWATTALWLKRPVKAPTLPRDQVIADAYAALNPSDAVWREYQRTARTLVDRGDMTEDDYVTLRYIQARQALVELEVADEPVFTEGGVHEILRRSRDKVRDELLAELEEVRQEADKAEHAAMEDRQKEQKAAQERLDAAHEERHQLEEEYRKALTASRQDTEIVAARVARWVRTLVVGVVALVLVAGAVAAWLVPSIAKWSALPKVIVTVLAVVFVASSVAALVSGQSASRMGRSLEDRLKRALTSGHSQLDGSGADDPPEPSIGRPDVNERL